MNKDPTLVVDGGHFITTNRNKYGILYHCIGG
jgi:hypothetical protein